MNVLSALVALQQLVDAGAAEREVLVEVPPDDAVTAMVLGDVCCPITGFELVGENRVLINYLLEE